MKMKDWFYRMTRITPPPQQKRIKAEQEELMQRLERQLSAERKVLRFDR